ncbi:MAG: glucose-6-phosphate isomerase [Betaproteobacteria bacterium]|nr:glucose-6-phosphate isomerase [Betaproteobacteria bacterium]
MTDLTASPAWRALGAHFQNVSHLHLHGLFATDPDRFARFSVEAGPLFLDYSKNLITDDTLPLLRDLAEQQGLADAIRRMFAGEHVNATEDRAAMHTALRAGPDAEVMVDGRDVMPDVRDVLAKVRAFSDAVRNGQLRGQGDQPFTDVVNIGIGGSDLGPLMVTEALGAYRDGGPAVHFVSNVDDTHLLETIRHLQPATTLFIVSSKTFTTQETMTNAASARRWLIDALGESAVGNHFAAVSTNLEATADFGIAPERVFRFWDWVGGRYSLWSAIGLPIAIAVGMDNFEALLRGARTMDEHFRDAPFDRNLPVILGLLGVWYADFFGYETHAVLPYDQYLHRLPAYLQQLHMESNGKSVDLEGQPTDYATGPIVWGEPGTNGQHAFFQLLHQGTHVVQADFIVAARGLHGMGPHHDMLLANCLAQTQALALGRSAESVEQEMVAAGTDATEARRLAPFRSFSGNRPTNTIVLERLAPDTLGALVAAYEHKVYVQAVIWGINPFDQWGVELGKQLASRLLPMLSGADARTPEDCSTAGLLARIRTLRSS